MPTESEILTIIGLVAGGMLSVVAIGALAFVRWKRVDARIRREQQDRANSRRTRGT
jgi:hypothetical protein